MKTAALLLLLLSCTSTEKEIYIKYTDKSLQINSQKAPKGNQFNIQCLVKKNNEVYSTPAVTVYEKKPAVIKVCKEIFIPDYWTHPFLVEKEGFKMLLKKQDEKNGQRALTRNSPPRNGPQLTVSL